MCYGRCGSTLPQPTCRTSRWFFHCLARRPFSGRRGAIRSQASSVSSPRLVTSPSLLSSPISTRDEDGRSPTDSPDRPQPLLGHVPARTLHLLLHGGQGHSPQAGQALGSTYPRLDLPQGHRYPKNFGLSSPPSALSPISWGPPLGPIPYSLGIGGEVPTNDATDPIVTITRRASSLYIINEELISGLDPWDRCDSGIMLENFSARWTVRRAPGSFTSRSYEGVRPRCRIAENISRQTEESLACGVSRSRFGV
jgi:hypothetical protein